MSKKNDLPGPLKAYLQSIEDDLSDGLVGTDESDGAADDVTMMAAYNKRRENKVKSASKLMKSIPSSSKKSKPTSKSTKKSIPVASSSNASSSSTRSLPPVPKKPSDSTTLANSQQAIPIYVLGGQTKKV